MEFVISWYLVLIDFLFFRGEDKSNLLSLVKAFDSVLNAYEGFCNLKQVFLIFPCIISRITKSCCNASLLQFTVSVPELFFFFFIYLDDFSFPFFLALPSHYCLLPMLLFNYSSYYIIIIYICSVFCWVVCGGFTLWFYT